LYLHLVLFHDFDDGAEEGHPAVLDLRLPLLLVWQSKQLLKNFCQPHRSTFQEHEGHDSHETLLLKGSLTRDFQLQVSE
jgi:hypothetical protein